MLTAREIPPWAAAAIVQAARCFLILSEVQAMQLQPRRDTHPAGGSTVDMMQRAEAGPGQVRAAQERMHSLDALRTVAMLNVVLVHAAMSFAVKAPAGWAALDRSRSYLFDVGIFAAVGFTVQVFFVMAGFFAAQLLARQGLAGFAWSRLRRIGVPFAVALVLLVPAIQAVGLFGSARKAVPGTHPGFAAAAVDFFTSRLFWQSYTLGHLWFLWYLILLYTALLVVVALARRLPAPVALDRWVAAVAGSRARPLLLAIPTAALMAPMNWMIDTPLGVVPELHILAYYALFFGIGALLARQPELLSVQTAAWRWYLAVAGVVALPATFGLIVMAAASGQLRDSAYYDAAMVCCALYTWLMIFGLLGLFQRWASRPIAAIRYLSEASFWIYLIHFPIVLLLQILIKDMALPALLKFALVVAISALLLLGSYQLLVRHTVVGALLNGRRASEQRVSQAALTGQQTVTATPEGTL